MRLNGPGQFGRLSGAQIGNFKKALLDAFSTVPAFDQMVTIYLDRNRQAIALGDDLGEIVFKVIGQAEANSWTAELLAGARTASPDNEALLTFAQPFGLAPATPQWSALQNAVRAANPTLDPEPWRSQMGLLEGRVCRVEVYSGAPPETGTAFLLGANVAMTNYHVVESVIKKAVTPDKVALRFDFKARADGVQVRAGTVYELADDWLIDESAYSTVDETGGPDDPPETELDYALLRVKGSPGNDPVGGPDLVLPNPTPRGWIDIPAKTHDFKTYHSVFILQHPGDGPLKFAMDTESVIGLNGNNTRVKYKTTTAPGSSGSPCFDGSWNLIALHHSGDPKYANLRKADYNQGVPLAAILKLLDARDKRKLLGQA